MEVWHAIVLGIIQGLSEFLPISSSGHLIIVSTILQGKPLSMSLDVALHVGTFVALLLYFWKDWWQMFLGNLSSIRERKWNTESKILSLILIGTIPAAVVGKLLVHEIEHFFGSHPYLVCIPLVVVGILLWWVDKVAPIRRELKDLKVKDGILIGLAQACALFPGTSRSGATIMAGRWLGLDRTSAARFSFLLGTPAMAGAALLKSQEILASIHLPEFYLGILTSAVVGFFVIAFFMRYLQTHGFGVFALYRIILAAVSLFLLMSGKTGGS